MVTETSEIIKRFVVYHGTQDKAARALGITTRTLYNYIKKPERVPRGIVLGMKYVLENLEEN